MNNLFVFLVFLAVLQYTTTTAFVIVDISTRRRRTTTSIAAFNAKQTKNKEIITIIDSPKQFSRFIGNVNDSKTNNKSDESDDSPELCVLKIHASWCKSCQKFSARYQQIASKYNHIKDYGINGKPLQQQNKNIHFGSIEFGKNSKLCKELGIIRLPTVMFYIKGKEDAAIPINSFPCGPKNFYLFKETLEKYSQMSKEELVFEKDQLIFIEDDKPLLTKTKEESIPTDTKPSNEGTKAVTNELILVQPNQPTKYKKENQQQQHDSKRTKIIIRTFQKLKRKTKSLLNTIHSTNFKN